MLVSDFFQAVLTFLISGVVDQNVELIEVVDSGLDRCAREFRICQIAFYAQRATSFGFNRRLSFFRIALFFRQVGEGDISAFAGEHHGHRATDAGVAAGNQSDFAGEFVRTSVVRREIMRPRFHL